MTSRLEKEGAPRRHQVTSMLRLAIATGEVEPGTRLRERVLCEELGVSRTSVREALRELESEGLVTSMPHRGAIVATFERRDAEDIFATRGALEALLLRQFAERASDRQIKQLGEVVRALTEEPEKHDVESFTSRKYRFYEIVAEGARNRSAASALRPIYARVARIWFAELVRSGRIAACAREVQDIYEAVARRDGKAAEEACIRHYQNIIENVVRAAEAREANVRPQPETGGGSLAAALARIAARAE
ncbi:GntR family transcriptional regulator [Afifella sp. IM 167]|uniref:GntR family transcriptional regulator n=1 Tax=Afifella sp. IM 167 TaxID=2033586 RepID=UPI001CCEC18C|nr:GntR family transcriptional regulator [Afifella sp. IM 167]